jgi:hypothetical protein
MRPSRRWLSSDDTTYANPAGPATAEPAQPTRGMPTRDMTGHMLAGSTPANDALNALLEQVSRGSRPAFAALFDQTQHAVHTRLEAIMSDRSRVAPALAAVYVEVWWLAGCRTQSQQDVLAWIDEITRRRAAGAASRPLPRQRDGSAANGQRHPGADYAVRELAGLLGRPMNALNHRG